MIALVTGGSGCGKSHYAERLIRRLSDDEQMFYIATMDAYDDECRARVARHRRQREGLGFVTVERPRGLVSLASELPPGASAILECVPTLLSNEMFSPGGDPDSVLPGVLALAERCSQLVVVTNDVFSDGMSYDKAVEDYRRRLAAIHRAVAALADAVVEVVYSIPVALKGELP